jgi:hypothetical protein
VRIIKLTLLIFLIYSCDHGKKSNKTTVDAVDGKATENNTIMSDCYDLVYQIQINHNESQQLVTYAPDPSGKQTCEQRKSTAIFKCSNGYVEVSGELHNELECQDKKNIHCEHPLTGHLPDSTAKKITTYKEKYPTKKATCEDLAIETVFSCQKGKLELSNTPHPHSSCTNILKLESCYDKTSNTYIKNNSSIQIESYSSQELIGENACEQDKKVYTATCSNKKLTQSGELQAYRNCVNLSNQANNQNEKVYFSFSPFGPPFVICNGEFDVHLLNKTANPAQIVPNSIKLIGPTTGTDYFTSIETLESGCATIPPGGGCSFRIKNKIELENADVATPLFELDVNFTNNQSTQKVDRIYYNEQEFYPYITLQGC